MFSDNSHSFNHSFTMKKIAFIGLGVMGYPMAGHLSRAGYAVTVFNRSLQKGLDWTADYHGECVESPEQAVQDADIVFLCVGDDKDLQLLVLGDEGLLKQMKAQAVLVDHTTASAEIAREMSSAATELGIGFVDAPVSGGQAGAENASLTIMCGGESAAFDLVEPVMQSYARAVTLMGPAGSGQLCKMVNQICIAGLLQGLSEGLNFGAKSGLDMEAVVEVIGKGAAQSWQMDNRAATMLNDEFEFGFAVDWMRKDLQICLDEAGRNGARLPVTALIDQWYAAIQAQGGQRWDTSSLIRLLNRD
ncbi:MAG: NAD(P)-dependent oxidoreductase [Pseudomonadota bacterium]